MSELGMETTMRIACHSVTIQTEKRIILQTLNGILCSLPCARLDDKSQVSV